VILLVIRVFQTVNNYKEIWHIVQHMSKLAYGNLSENKGSFWIKQCFVLFLKKDNFLWKN